MLWIDLPSYAPSRLTLFIKTTSYGRILLNATVNFDSRSIERMQRIFAWIAFAKRPLRSLELLSALSFSDGDVTKEEVAPIYVFELCAPLVEPRRDSTYSFIHVSVKE